MKNFINYIYLVRSKNKRSKKYKVNYRIKKCVKYLKYRTLPLLNLYKINKYYKSVAVLIITSINRLILESTVLFIMFTLAFIARYSNKKVDVGLGPEPLINNIYHKKALEKYGFMAETFVVQTYFITEEFDIRGDKMFHSNNFLWKFILYFFGIDRFFVLQIYFFVFVIFRYKILYLYFNGGPLLFIPHFRKVEPLLYHIARIKTVVMPYGGDIHVLSRSTNLLFKHAMSVDYPQYSKNQRRTVEEQVDLWTKYADYVISGCDWSRYMYAWDRLMLGHFSIDTEMIKPKKYSNKKKIVILHAPNHKTIKGTKYFIDAVNELSAEGYPVVLKVIQKVPNYILKKMISKADIIADQLIIGWYAMFALEGMSMEKPVLCYIDKEFEDLYTFAGLIKKGELPLVNCNIINVKQKIKKLIEDKVLRRKIGIKSRKFVIKHHSVMYIGSVFDTINRSLNVLPSQI